MAKRFHPLKEFGRTSKKPKLDISVNRYRQENQTPSRISDNIHSNLNQAPKPINDLWDDDEDDVILLATQVAESEIAAVKRNMEITESELTFTEFQPKVQQHSTQRQTDHQIDLLSQMFDDDDDFARLAAVAEKESKKCIPKSEQLFEPRSEVEVFKKPELPSCSKPKSNGPDVHTKDNANQNMLSQAIQDPSASSRKQLATERQVQFLMERLENLKQENSKLNKDLNDIKDNMQAKSGEASMLRDELKRAKKQLENLKMEKLLHNDAMNTENKTKIEQLVKEVKSKESQLQLKNMECSVLKMRQADESRRFEMSMRDYVDEVPIPVPKNKIPTEAIVTVEKSLPSVLACMRLRKLKISSLPQLMESNTAFITKDAFARADERGVSKKFNTFFQQELEELQRILATVKLKPMLLDSETSKKLTDSVRKVFSEFWSYVHTLEFGLYDKVLPYHDYKIMEDKSIRKLGCLHLSTELYNGERGLNLRRYIACLSAICQQSSAAARIILAAKHEDYPLMQIAIDAVNKLGYSLEVNAHFGIVEACAVLTRSILLHLQKKSAEEKPFKDLVFAMLKHLVFTRPNPWAFLELSYSVLDCTKRFSNIVSMFCVNSPRKHFIADRSKSIYRFSNDACFLQVYCGLMEAAFPLYRQLSNTHFELQTQLCLNHVKFVFNCLTEPPHFVAKMLPCDDDDENVSKEEQNQTSVDKRSPEVSKEEAPSTSRQAASMVNSENSKTSSSTLNSISISPNANITCDCFTQMCLSVVTNIWLTLRQWLRTEKEIQTKRVSQISRIAVHLLYLIFCDNYLTCLFREDEETTRHYLYLICTYWSENTTELQFTEIQLNLLQKLKEAHALPKTLNEEESKLENISSDLAQWNQMTNDNTSDSKPKDRETIVKQLHLLEDIFDPDLFFAGLNRDHLQLEIFGDT